MNNHPFRNPISPVDMNVVREGHNQLSLFSAVITWHSECQIRNPTILRGAPLKSTHHFTATVSFRNVQDLFLDSSPGENSQLPTTLESLYVICFDNSQHSSTSRPVECIRNTSKWEEEVSTANPCLAIHDLKLGWFQFITCIPGPTHLLLLQVLADLRRRLVTTPQNNKLVAHQKHNVEVRDIRFNHTASIIWIQPGRMV